MPHCNNGATGAWAILPPEETAKKEIEIVDGMRFWDEDGDLFQVELRARDGAVIFGEMAYDLDHVRRMIADGTLSPKPPPAPPPALAFGLRLRRQSDGIETVVHVTEDWITTIDAAGVTLTYDTDRVRRHLRDGAWTIVDAIPVESTTDFAMGQVEADRVRLAVEIAEWRKATGEMTPGDAARAIRRSDASELLYETAFERLVGLFDGATDDRGYARNREALKAAGGNPSHADAYYQGISDEIAALRKRAAAAEYKLADAMAHGLDALPAMYPAIKSLRVRRGANMADVSRGCSTEDDRAWFTSGTEGTFREALHAAVLAVGGKLHE